jgi:hypothetical protein
MVADGMVEASNIIGPPERPIGLKSVHSIHYEISYGYWVKTWVLGGKDLG